MSYMEGLYTHLGYERVYLPLYKVADTPFHIQDDDNILYPYTVVVVELSWIVPL